MQEPDYVVKLFKWSQGLSAKTASKTVPGRSSEMSTTQGPVSVCSLDAGTLFQRKKDCSRMYVASGPDNGL